MIFRYVKIKNYRNLDGVEFLFNESLNFLIGENNLGKSNFIDLLDALFYAARFDADDFDELETPIIIEFIIRLTETEQKIFAVDENEIHIIARQQTADSNLIYVNEVTGKNIRPEEIRCVNFFRHDTIGSDTATQGLSSEVFKKISNLYKNRYGDLENAITNDKILITTELAILKKICAVSKTRKQRIDTACAESEDARFPIVLAFDELEMHLRPYHQRSVVRHLNEIIGNGNSFFSQILANELNIKSLAGQLFLVTHSPNILLNDYKQFVRFFKNEGKVGVVCGEAINVKNDKHLFKNFIYFKEAFFAKSVIVVEGDTEFAALPEFAEKLLRSHGLDSYGVSVIKADGKSSVNSIMSILKAFKIRCVGMVDRDDDSDELVQDRLKTYPFTYTTSKRDFEEELLEKLTPKNFSLLDEFLFSCDEEKERAFISVMRDVSSCKKKIKKYNLNFEYETQVKKELSIPNYAKNTRVMKLFYLSLLNKCKGIAFWHELGFQLDKKFIPQVYKSVIFEAAGIEPKKTPKSY